MLSLRTARCGGGCAGVGGAAGDEHRDAAQGRCAAQRVQDFHVIFPFNNLLIARTEDYVCALGSILRIGSNSHHWPK